MKYKYSDELISQLVKESTSIADVCKKLLLSSGSSHKHISNRVKKLKLDTSHFKKGAQVNREKHKLSPEEIFLKSSTTRVSAFQLRRALLESGVEHKCAKCGILPIWNNESLTLEVDHIDSNWKNNSKENLRFLCPNCHSQYSDKTRASLTKGKQKYYCECGKEISRASKRCIKCHSKNRAGLAQK